jgi:hypothetical protein
MNPILTKMMALIPASKPDTLNYDNFTFRAVVDWVELHLRTLSPTNHWTVTGLMGVPYAAPLDEGPGGAATWFSVKVHNPKNWQEVQDVVDGFKDKHPLREEPVVAAIEIALDAYSKFEDHDDLNLMAARFVKYSTHIGHVDNRRFKSTVLSPTDDHLASHRETIKRLNGDFTFYAGDHKPTDGRPISSQAMRVYLKQTDAGKKLPVAEHRARTERTLTMTGFEQRPLSWWKRRNFTEYSEYYKFRMLKPLLPAGIRHALDELPQVGEAPARKRASGGGVRKYRRSTVADVKLNRLAYEALRGLTDRMQYVSRIAKARKVARIAGLRVS